MTTLNADLYASEKETSDTVTMAVRMPRELRDDFAALCASRNIEMAVVIRRFLEREVSNNSFISTPKQM
jgi:hypothetical protein